MGRNEARARAAGPCSRHKSMLTVNSASWVVSEGEGEERLGNPGGCGAQRQRRQFVAGEVQVGAELGLP